MPLTCPRTCSGTSAGSAHPLRRKVIAPSETRIRTLLHLIDTEILDEIIGGWLRDLADAGKLDGLLTAIAIDGKWLRGSWTGRSSCSPPCSTRRRPSSPSVRVPDDTTETTQVKALLASVDLDERGRHRRRRPLRHRDRAVHRGEAGGRRPRRPTTSCCVKGNHADLSSAPCFDAIQASGPGRAPDYTETGPLPRAHHPPLPLGRRRQRN